MASLTQEQVNGVSSGLIGTGVGTIGGTADSVIDYNETTGK